MDLLDKRRIVRGTVYSEKGRRNDFKLGTKEWSGSQQWSSEIKWGNKILSQVQWPHKRVGNLRRERTREEIPTQIPD